MKKMKDEAAGVDEVSEGSGADDSGWTGASPESLVPNSSKQYSYYYYAGGIWTLGGSCRAESPSFDVSGPGETLTVSMAAIRAGGDYRLYHLPSGGDWEVITPTVADGSITAKVSGFSPYGLVEVSHNTHYHHWADTVVEPTASTWGYTMHTCECGESYVDSYVAPTGSTGSGSVAAARATSPKTGETDTAKAMATLFMCAAGALAFGVVSGRRKSA